jgi:ABC-2 type transport system ATP-binding protein
MIIEVQDLTKRYGNVVALKGISLGIEAGRVVGLLGHNGAGKTTFMETLQGLRTPTSGKVSVFGLDPERQAQPLKELVGVQLQSTAVPEELTPLETLRLFGAFFRKTLSPEDVLERIGLTEKAKSRNDTLSGGQRKRLAIGMALINDPELIILDEPSSGLDPAARREIHRHIHDLGALKKTVLMSTQYMEEAEKLCDRVIVIRAGEVVADGSPQELISRATRTVALSIVLEGEYDPTPLLQTGALVEEVKGGRRSFLAPDPKAAIVVLGKLLQKPDATLVDLRMRYPNLEDVYLKLMDGFASGPRQNA